MEEIYGDCSERIVLHDMSHAGDGKKEAATRAHAHAVDCEWAEWENARRKTRQANLQTIVL